MATSVVEHDITGTCRRNYLIGLGVPQEFGHTVWVTAIRGGAWHVETRLHHCGLRFSRFNQRVERLRATRDLALPVYRGWETKGAGGTVRGTQSPSR
jgi:hypothetical protein